MILRWLAAILALGCRSLRISGNTVDQARLADPGDGRAFGIASDLAFEELQVSENTVRRLSDETRGGDPAPTGNSIALAIGDLLGDVRAIIVEAETSYYAIYPYAIYNYVYQPRVPTRLMASVRGNNLQGVGANPTVVIEGVGPLTFAENQVSLDAIGAEQTTDLPPAVLVDAQTLVLPDNQVRSTWLDKGAAVEATVPIIGERPMVTATGNITDGDIRVNGQPIGNPWKPLNIRVS